MLLPGRRFRTLNILDEGIRELLAIVIDTLIPSGRVIRTLEQVREITEGWMKIYNEYRPHDALGRILPAMYMRNLVTSSLKTGPI